MQSVGDRIGPWELAELVAVRPVANLWRATRADALSRGQREVVLRVVHDPNDMAAMAELRREYDALRAVDDPRIRRAHGFYAGFGALALEFVDGVSLSWAAARAREADVGLDTATVLDLAVEIANALRVAHDAGVVHGRVCVDTVRLRRDGGVVLTDFALPLDRLPVLAPELADGQFPSAATDQWLLGALMVHLLLGEPLLGGVAGRPGDGRLDVDPWLRRVLAMSPTVGRLLVKILATDPRERYGSESVLIKDLLAALRSCDEPPRRDQLARRLHIGRPSLVAPVIRSRDARPAGSASSPALPMERGRPHVPVLPASAALLVPSPSIPSPTIQPGAERPELDLGPAFLPVPALATPDILEHPDAQPEFMRDGVATRRSFSGEHQLVQAVIEEEPPVPAPPVEAEEERDRPSAPAWPLRRDRIVPDWVAAWALVLLLAVGLWAILTRIL